MKKLRRLRQSELPLDVEQDVCLALAHGLRVGGKHGRVVEVEPVVVLRHECSVMTGASSEGGNTISVSNLLSSHRVIYHYHPFSLVCHINWYIAIKK